MALSDPYVTAEEYKAAKGKVAAGQDLAITMQLTGVARYIDAKLNKPYGFGKDSVATPRILTPVDDDRSLLDGRGRIGGYGSLDHRSLFDGRNLFADEEYEIASAVGLEIRVDLNRVGNFVGLTPFSATDYQLKPLNAALRPEPRPYTNIYIPWWSTAYRWSSLAPVQVTAIWGWPAVPKAIQMVNIELTAIWREESSRATNRFTDLGDFLSNSRESRDMVNSLMLPYGNGPAVG